MSSRRLRVDEMKASENLAKQAAAICNTLDEATRIDQLDDALRSVDHLRGELQRHVQTVKRYDPRQQALPL